jgi:hypothetical protein
MKLLFILLFSMFSGFAHSGQCRALFGLAIESSAVQSPGVLHHVVRPDHSYSESDFIDLLYSSVQSARDLQNWPNESMSGQIWTTAKGHNDLYTNGFSVYFTLKKNMKFYDPISNGNQLWLNWIAKNKNTKNTFPKIQTERLRSANDPWHSEFYKQHGFAGLLNRYGTINDMSAQNDLTRNAYNIVDMSSISELEVVREFQIYMPENSKYKYVPTNFNQERHHFVFGQ